MRKSWLRGVVRVVNTVAVCMGLVWCQDRPPPETRSYDVAFPRNTMACTPESGRLAKRWIDRAQHRNFPYRAAVRRADLATGGGPALTRPPARTRSIDLFALYADGDKITDLSALRDGPPRADVADALGAGEAPYTFAISSTARTQDVLEVWSHTRLEGSVSLALRVPPESLEVEPVPASTRARLGELLGDWPDATKLERVANQSARLNGAMSGMAASCAPLRELDSARERTSFEDSHALFGEDLVDAWLACGCGFDLEVLTAGYHGRHLGEAPALVTSRALPISPSRGIRMPWPSLRDTTWAQAAPSFLQAQGQGFCVEDAPQEWCARPGRAMLCEGSCAPLGAPRP
jgi:hypothetical protein